MFSRLRQHLFALLFVVAILAILPGYLWPYSLTGASAAPTILVHDTFLVNRTAYDLRIPYTNVTLAHIRNPRREEIVQAYLPEGIGLAIKRVVGLPGETIEMRENRVYINGTPLPSRVLAGADFSWAPMQHHMGSTVAMEDGHWVAYSPGSSKYRNSGPVLLGSNEYFLMGDNRDNSYDSRGFGPVARDQIVAKLIAVFPTGERLGKHE